MFAQLLWNGLATGSLYALLAVPLAVAYRSIGFFDFSQAATLAVAAYAALAVSPFVGPWPVGSVLVGVGVAGVLTAVSYTTVVLPLWRKRSPSTMLLLASVGVFTLAEAMLLLLFGAEAKALSSPALDGVIDVPGSARLTRAHVVIILSAALVLIGWYGVLRLSRFGLRWRAVAANAALAEAIGVDVQQVARPAYWAAGCTAGFAGVLQAYDTGLTPAMGFGTLLVALVAVIIGRGSILLSASAALGLGVTRQLVVIVAPTYWQDAVVFLILLIFLVLQARARGG